MFHLSRASTRVLTIVSTLGAVGCRRRLFRRRDPRKQPLVNPPGVSIATEPLDLNPANWRPCQRTTTPCTGRDLANPRSRPARRRSRPSCAPSATPIWPPIRKRPAAAPGRRACAAGARAMRSQSLCDHAGATRQPSAERHRPDPRTFRHARSCL